MCIIRDAKPEDVKTLSEISRKSLHESWSENGFLSEINRPVSNILVYEKDGNIKGFLVFSMAADEAEVLTFAVEESCRKQGIGKELFVKMLELLKEHGTVVLYLDVRKSNMTAISFYKKMGMTEIAQRKGFYDNPREDAAIFRMQI